MLQDYTITYRNARVAYLGELSKLMRYGEVTDSRNGKVRENLNTFLHIENPIERYLLVRHRHDNVFHKIAETLWVLAGRNDVDWLSAYLPQAARWSDDGHTWRAGYGARLRRFGGKIDQLEHCVKILNADPSSRRAVMSIFDPNSDFENTKDVPCNNWIHWLIRDNTLHMNVAQRSSDIMWGFSGINYFEWSVLHQLMASWTGSRVGRLTYFISSLHIYEPHWDKANIILRDASINYQDYPSCTLDETSFKFDTAMLTLGAIFMHEENYRNFKFEHSLQCSDDLLRNFSQTLKIYWMLKHGSSEEELAPTIASLGKTDLALAVLEYIGHHIAYNMELLYKLTYHDDTDFVSDNSMFLS